MTTALESGERQSLSQAVDGIHGIKHVFHVSDSAVGWLPFAMAIVGVLGAFPIGVLTDRVRRTWLLAIAMLVWTACMGLNGLALGYAFLVAARLGVGAVEANGPAAVSLLSDYYPVKDRARMMGLYQSGALAGAIPRSNTACSIPTWIAPRLPPPPRTKAVCGRRERRR